MKYQILAIVLLGLAAVYAAEEFHESEDDFEKEFGILDSDPEEKKKEAEQLAEAEDEINKENAAFDAGEATFQEKLYPESDLPKEEFEKEKEGAVLPEGSRLNGIIMPPEEMRTNPENERRLKAMYRNMNRATPDTYDATSLGLVTDAKSQKSCGSCAAFSATGLHETCMIKAGAPKSGLDLSEQYLVDCGYNSDSMNACDGAYPHSYQEWFKNDGGQAPHEVTYPYLDRSPKLSCPSGVSKFTSGAKVANVVYDYSCNADKLKDMVAANGAVSVALYASDNGFGNYASGVFQGCTSTSINHAVLVVGYGTEGGVDYWLVKNSWGTNWGDKGFIKIKRGSNECGIEGICVTATCGQVNGGAADTAPTTVAPPPVPAAMYCDVSSLFGPGVTGSYTLHVGTSSGLIVSSVTCDNSSCTPTSPGPTNACVYICGQTTC